MQVGWTGKYNTHEVYFYCLDTLPIFLAFCVYSLLHFGRYLDAALALQLPTTAKQIVMVSASGGSTAAHTAATAQPARTMKHDSKLDSMQDAARLAA